MKEYAERNRGRNVRRVMAEVKVFIRGWLGYFHVADMKRTMKSWDEWLRRRFRMYIWKQWKKPRTKVANLRKLGIPADKAYQWGEFPIGLLANRRKPSFSMFHYQRKTRNSRIF
ncbi:MAG: hypothetical protein BHW29_08255 [Faecalibacterium sp. CAG:74_58_120]|nr:MAG: hypothetical protein BHW29_08255 [Faecalibacterium sp. CAG:74_58_120]